MGSNLHRWTPAEDAIIRENYPDIGALTRLLPTRSTYAIRSRVRDAKIPMPDGAFRSIYWTSGREHHLRELYPTASISELQREFGGRSIAALHQRAALMGIIRQGPIKDPSGERDSPRWTPDAYELLAYLYPSAPKRIIELAFPFAIWGTICRRASAIGLHRRTPSLKGRKYWTEAETVYLRAHYTSSEQETLLGGLSRFTWSAIQHKAERLGLSRQRYYDLPPSTVPLAEEIWARLPSMGARYWVSTLGRVAGRRGLMRPYADPHGILTVYFTVNGRRSNRAVAALVLSTFVKPAPRGDIVAYRDGNKANTTLANLHWTPRRKAVAPREQKDTSTPIGQRLLEALSYNSAYAAANQSVSRKLPREVRDDVIQDMIVAHLSGELPLIDFAGRAGDFVRAHNRAFGSFGMRSLDDLIGGTDLRLGDTVNEEDYHERWEALGS